MNGTSCSIVQLFNNQIDEINIQLYSDNYQVLYLYTTFISLPRLYRMKENNGYKINK